MDQETANVLFDKGAILLILDPPENLEFGIDYNAWSTGPLFKGVKLIPPGLHFVFYRYVEAILVINLAKVVCHTWLTKAMIAQQAKRVFPVCELGSFDFLKLERYCQ
jgi:AAR2 protein